MDIKWIDENAEGMEFHRHKDVLWLSFPEFDRHNWLMNGFTTREGGVSQGYLATMNMGLDMKEEVPEFVHENYRRASEAMGFDPEKLVCSAQTHSKNVRVVTEEDLGRGYSRDRGWSNVDAMVTNVPGAVLSTVYADCVPLYFIDPKHKAIGLAHSGWAGTVRKIGRETINRMMEEYGSDPKDMYAAIGPCISQDCYEVNHDVARMFPSEYYYETDNGKYQLDLIAANTGILLDAGIPSDHISYSNLCTCSNPDLLFSHRATNGNRGLNGAFLSIRENEISEDRSMSDMVNINDQILSMESKVERARQTFEQLTYELQQLREKQKEMQAQDIMNAFKNSNRSYEDIMNFLMQGSDQS